ncbi:glycosyltransferase family 29 protein [Alteromonas sp. D210916BOD_24]|uniref:glycosyltransferase family 29 protein n=1 Tax=Alteromonas sp. D210916BOD_24 TaxID=3157618 RepID=UPI00399D0BA1
MNRKLVDDFWSIASAVEGKHVALVGNARSLCSSTYGNSIDANDIVIRINRAPKYSTSSHGVKTDWLALATSIKESHYRGLSTKKLIWMSHKRKRIQQWMMNEPFYLFPQTLYLEIKARLGAPPSTGIMMLYWLSNTSLASLNVYGFDFFKSLSLTGSRTEKQVPHDFAAEQEWFQELVGSRNNVFLHQ